MPRTGETVSAGSGAAQFQPVRRSVGFVDDSIGIEVILGSHQLHHLRPAVGACLISKASTPLRRHPRPARTLPLNHTLEVKSQEPPPGTGSSPELPIIRPRVLRSPPA